METSFVKTENGKLIFTLLSGKGDERTVWDFEDPQEVEEALQKFNEYINQNYTAIILDENGKSEGAMKKDEWNKLDVQQRQQFFDKPKEVVFIPLQFGG